MNSMKVIIDTATKMIIAFSEETPFLTLVVSSDISNSLMSSLFYSRNFIGEPAEFKAWNVSGQVAYSQTADKNDFERALFQILFASISSIIDLCESLMNLMYGCKPFKNKSI